MSKYIHDKNEKIDIEKIFNKISNCESIKNYNFDFLYFLKVLGYSGNYEYSIIQNIDYLKFSINSMKTNWKSTEWESYWVSRIILFAARYHKNLFKIFFDFYFGFMLNVEKNPTKSDITMDTIKNIMNTTISKYYLKSYENKEEIDFCNKLVKLVKYVFYERLKYNSWLHIKTKTIALNKLNKMNFCIGYKNKWENDTEIKFCNNDSLGNIIKYNEWFTDKIISEINGPVPDKYEYWLKHQYHDVYVANAYFNNLLNTLIVPNGILQKPFVNLNKDISYNMANIGCIISHEMVHAFDDEGCKYDENGNLNDWWLKEDKCEYEKRQKYLIKHYEKKTKQDGKIKLTENISDIVGFLIAEDVLNLILSNMGLSDNEKILCFKRFFVYYAKKWRNVDKSKKNHLNVDNHSDPTNRVNFVLSYSDKFKKIFKIKKNDKMYYDYKEKAKIF